MKIFVTVCLFLCAFSYGVYAQHGSVEDINWEFDTQKQMIKKHSYGYLYVESEFFNTEKEAEQNAKNQLGTKIETWVKSQGFQPKEYMPKLKKRISVKEYVEFMPKYRYKYLAYILKSDITALLYEDEE